MIVAAQWGIALVGEIAAVWAAYRLAIARNRNVGGWVLLAIGFNWLAVFALAVKSYRYGDWSPRAHCAACAVSKSPVVVQPGTATAQLVLLALGFIPGIIYGIWRKAGETLECANCGSGNIVMCSAPSRSLYFQPADAALPRTTVPR